MIFDYRYRVLINKLEQRVIRLAPGRSMIEFFFFVFIATDLCLSRETINNKKKCPNDASLL